ncbi:MAG TPA: ATP-binding protein, partial [Polyangiales bacterium]|nr:ATP-binding protein [Polyangiales bacterium]
QGGHPAVGILLLTMHRHTEQIVEGLSAGANDYLAKPYADAELLARVRAQLRARQLLERAEQAEAINFQLLQTAPDALLALDDVRRVVFVNESARTALEAKSPLVLGTPLAELLPELDKRLQTGSSAVQLPDVTLGDRVFSPTLRSVAASQTFNTIIALRDVTERRRLDLRRLDFYSIIAHDLRSPLHGLTLRTRLLLEGARGDLSRPVLDELRKMDGSIAALVELIDDFLQLATLDNVEYKLASEAIDLHALALETLETLRPELDAHALTWRTEAERPAMVRGDARRLQQVLINLMSNAVKFTGRCGTITMRIELCDQEIEFSVRDTGRGIAAQDLPSIFDRYTRSSSARDDVPGTGLGLMIVREIVEAHGGRVGVESTLGTGSRFWFRLPATSPRG